MYLPKGWRGIPRRMANDERVLRLGLKAFAVYIALALYADDLGSVRCDPRQLALIVFGDRRLVREQLCRLVEAGLVRPYLAPSDRPAGKYAPELSGEFNSWFAGRSTDGRWLSFIWLPDVVVSSLSRQRNVVVTSPSCPKSWLQKAGLLKFSIEMFTKYRAQTETETETETESSSASTPTYRKQVSIPDVGKERKAEELLQEITKCYSSEADVKVIENFVLRFLTEPEANRFCELGELPDRPDLQEILAKIVALLDNEDEKLETKAGRIGLWDVGLEGDRALICSMRGFLKHAKGPQTSLALLGSMLLARENFIEESK